MPKSYELISNSNVNRNGRPDANLANDSEHLGGIPAEDYATKEWVKDYHGSKESNLLDYINRRDGEVLDEAKEYANALVRNQDFSDFAGIDDLQALNTNLTNKINTDIANQESYTDQKTQAIVTDVNANFEDIEETINQINDGLNSSVSSLTDSINSLDGRVDDLFQSVSDGKEEIAEAITDKGVATSANDSFSTMANNIRKIDTLPSGDNNPLIVIPEGYMDTSDATATADKILQGYTAYANGNKLHGTYVPSGEGSAGGVILGPDEVVASKVYGEAGALIGQKVNTDGITLNCQALVRNFAFLHCSATYGGDFIIADRKMTENIDNEIVIYNISNAFLSHKSPLSKFSYTYSELGIEGEVLCIAASPLYDYDGIVQFTIGTSIGIYTYWFNPAGNDGNGSIGDSTIYSSKQKMVIEQGLINGDGNPGYNSIVYSNTDENVFAYYNGNFHIVNIAWSIDQIIEYTNVNISFGRSNVAGMFRFSLSDRFLIFAPWGETSNSVVGVILLDDMHHYQIHQILTDNADGATGWKNGQLAINPDDNFAIVNGKPYSLTYSLKDKTITWTKLSDAQLIPYNVNGNESLYACFSKNGKYVFALTQDEPIDGLLNLGCYKVDYENLNSTWLNISNPLLVPGNANGVLPPRFNLPNNKVVAFYPSGKENHRDGFYYYRSDPNVREVIGLSWNGNLYRQVVG